MCKQFFSFRNSALAFGLGLVLVSQNVQAASGPMCKAQDDTYRARTTTTNNAQRDYSKLRGKLEFAINKHDNALVPICKSLAVQRARLNEFHDRRFGDWLLGSGMKLEYAINHQEAVINALQGRYKAIDNQYKLLIARLAKDAQAAKVKRDKARTDYDSAATTLDTCLNKGAKTPNCKIPQSYLNYATAVVQAYETGIPALDTLREQVASQEDSALIRYDSQLERARARLGELKDMRELGVWFTKNGIKVEYDINHQEAVIDGISGQRKCVSDNYDAYFARLAAKQKAYQDGLELANTNLESATAAYQQCTGGDNTDPAS